MELDPVCCDVIVWRWDEFAGRRANFLKSAVLPARADLGRIALIMAIRSAINFLLMWELKETEKTSQDGAAD